MGGEKRIPEIDVRRVAELAKLALTPEEEARMGEELKAILAYFAMLDEVEVEDTEPLFNPHEAHARLREDVPAQPLDREEALADAPDRHLDFFRAPSPIREVRKEK